MDQRTHSRFGTADPPQRAFGIERRADQHASRPSHSALPPAALPGTPAPDVLLGLQQPDQPDRAVTGLRRGV